MFLARKISRPKWQNDDFSDGEIPADAVTADLRTQGNNLSFWQCGDGTADEVEEAALALAAGGDRVDKLDLVWISEDEFQEAGLVWGSTKGRTPVEDLNKLHIDLFDLDYVRLGNVANSVVSALNGRRYHRLSRGKVKKLLASAVNDRRVELGALNERIQKEVRLLLKD